MSETDTDNLDTDKTETKASTLVDWKNPPSLADLKTKLVSIGPTTSSAIHVRNGTVYHESSEQKISSLYSEIIKMDFCHEQP